MHDIDMNYQQASENEERGKPNFKGSRLMSNTF